MANEFQIRRGLPEDAGPLSQIAFSAKKHWGYPEGWMEMWTPQLTFSPEYFRESESWVAELDGNQVAFYTLQQKDELAWIDNLWVLPEHMGKGIGKTLFLHATALARQRGHKSLQLEADPNALGFYKKMGMYRIGERCSEVEGQLRSLPIMEMKL